MNGLLDPIWDAYATSMDALKVVHRCATLPAIDNDRPFRNTRFHRLDDEQCAELVDAAQEQIEDQTVLALYGVFEGALRDHLRKQSQHLADHATQPDLEFGRRLAEYFERSAGVARMDDVTPIFANAAGTELVAKVGSIRKYRHWVSHGRQWTAPPPVTARFAYDTLQQFLSRCGIG
ncbi:MAG: hypothetical protein HY718_14550 [Planctomycetes bacterium]|nr:hypothetical protein [Planctomycetota bacterium]